MGAEAIKQPVKTRVKGPELHAVTEAFRVSEKTLEAANDVVNDVIAEGNVSVSHEKKLAEAIAKDFAKEGLILTPEGEKKWVEEVHDIITPEEPPKVESLKGKEVDVDPFDFGRLSSTLKDLDKTYGQEKAGWNTVAKIFGLDDGFRNVTDGLWGVFFSFKGGALRKNVWKQVQDLGITRLKFNKVTDKDFKSIALKTSPVWAPFLFKYPMSILRNRAASLFDRAYIGLQEKINKRVSDSVVMGRFTKYQDIPASEVLSAVERGKRRR